MKKSIHGDNLVKIGRNSEDVIACQALISVGEKMPW